METNSTINARIEEIRKIYIIVKTKPGDFSVMRRCFNLAVDSPILSSMQYNLYQPIANCFIKSFVKVYPNKK